jgi:hypothetical protein
VFFDVVREWEEFGGGFGNFGGGSEIFGCVKLETELGVSSAKIYT